MSSQRASRLWSHAGVGFVEHEYLLAEVAEAMSGGTEEVMSVKGF